MGRDWNEGYNRNDLPGLYDDLDDMKYTGKKKTKKEKPYVIERMYANHIRFMWRSWSVQGRYETEEQGREALEQIIKNQDHGYEGMEIKKYKGFAFDKSLANIRIYLNGEPYVYYRLSKRD